MQARARHAVAQTDPTGLVYRDAPHPAVTRVGRVGPLLVDGEVPVDRPELVPADAGRRTGGDAVVHDERLVVAEVPVRKSVHHSGGKGVELLCRAGLRNTGTAVA